jgi:hypothetical protein
LLSRVPLSSSLLGHVFIEAYATECSLESITDSSWVFSREFNILLVVDLVFLRLRHLGKNSADSISACIRVYDKRLGEVGIREDRRGAQYFFDAFEARLLLSSPFPWYFAFCKLGTMGLVGEFVNIFCSWLRIK